MLSYYMHIKALLVSETVKILQEKKITFGGMVVKRRSRPWVQIPLHFLECEILIENSYVQVG